VSITFTNFNFNFSKIFKYSSVCSITGSIIKSSTYTYVISSGEGREALIIDPVIEHTDEYLKILEKLKLKLVKVIDTDIHADHITALNELNKRTSCTRIMGENSKSEVIDLNIIDNEKINIENINNDNFFIFK
jgi:glyoxylase-like metal-dependent hydrolase (beta-lactamase superfamily II)